MDFYAVLPSNASPDIYPENKTSHFKVQLSQRLELHGEWQVALLELYYPNTLSHVQPEQNWIKIYKPFSATQDNTAEAGPEYKFTEPQTHEDLEFFTSEEKLLVTPGHYANTANFIFALHEALTPVEKLNNDRGRSSVLEMTSNGHILIHPFRTCLNATYEFAPALARQMGLPHSGPYKADTEVLGLRPIDLSLGIPSQMFVYLDKVKEQIVGHTRSPLLRTIPCVVDAKFGTMTSYICEQPIYYDLNTKSFDTLEIDIRTHTGSYMPFEYGTSTVLCHFRPRA